MTIYLKIGQRIREKRKKAGITLEQISKSIKVTYQQIQKYENGQSRIPVVRLFELATLLNTPIQYFFDGLEIKPYYKKQQGQFIVAQPSVPLNIVVIDSNPVDEFITRKAIFEIDKDIKVVCIQNESLVMPILKNTDNTFPPADLIFMDVNISKQHYIDIIAEIKKERILQEIPLIILTNSLSVMDLSRTYRYGAAGFILKTEDFENFKNKMKTCLEYWGEVVVLPRAINESAIDQEKQR